MVEQVPENLEISAPQLILIVDDEEPIRSMLQDGLSRAGYDVETAASGPEALERFRVGRYAVVLTDLIMPAMTGWELSARLRSAESGLEG